MRHNGTKETTPFHIYKHEVAGAAGISVDRMDLGALYRAYDMGEPVWMIADEMKLRAEALMSPVKSGQLPRLERVCVRRVKF